MKFKHIIFLLFLLNVTFLHSQNTVLKFSAELQCHYQPLDSVIITNFDKDCDTTLYFPDTVLNLGANSIHDYSLLEDGFQLSQNYPNPFLDYTNIEMQVPNNEEYLLSIYDITGRVLFENDYFLNKGLHKFEFEAQTSGNYLLAVRSSQYNEHINMLKIGNSQYHYPVLNYQGMILSNELKSKSNEYFVFEEGDELIYTAYCTKYGIIYSDQISDFVTSNTDYLFEIDNTSPDQPGSIIGEQTVCENTSGIMFETEQIDGVTYLWNLPADWAITEGENTNNITVLTGSQNGMITVQTTNACGSSPASLKNVEVLKKSVAANNILGDSEICFGNPTSIEVSGGLLGDAAQWCWYKDACGENLINTGNSLDVTPENNTTYYIRAEGECNITDCISHEVIVHSNPTPSITGENSICEAEDLTLSVDQGISWSWTGSDSFESDSQNPQILDITTAASGNYFVTVTDENGCIGTDDFELEVKTLSSIPSDIIGNNTICKYLEEEFEVSGGYLGTNANWFWYSGSCGSTPLGTGDNISITADSETEYFVRAEGECNVTDCYNFTITINDLPEVILSSNQPVCEDSELEIFANGGVIYSWLGPNGFTYDNANIVQTAGLSLEGNFICTVTDINGCSNTGNISIDIKEKSTPPTSFSGNLGVCPDSETSITVSGEELGDGAELYWYGNSCGGNFVGNGSSQILNTTTATNYFVRVEGDCNLTDCLAVEIHDLFIPYEPTEDIHSNTTSTINWNWIESLNADGYKTNTVDNYSSAIDVGTNTTQTTTGHYCYSDYELYIWSYNECGVSEPITMHSNTAECVFTNCGDTVTYDGVNYLTSQFGDDCWFVENLKYLPSVVGPEIENDGTADQTKYYYVYDYEGTNITEAKETENYITYGALYNWYAAKSACPTGWHLPTDNDWSELDRFICQAAGNDGCADATFFSTSYTGYIGTDEGSRMSSNSELWEDGNLDGNEYFNSSGFNVIPGGNKIEGWDYFTGINTTSNYWVQYEVGNLSRGRFLQNTDARIFKGEFFKRRACSVRCIKD